MNYAEDRRDRRARNDNNGRDGDGALPMERAYAASRGHHGQRASILRDAGWNRPALYHYGVAWVLSLQCGGGGSSSCCGDYAAMADLSGFPEVGLVALLVSRLPQITKSTTATKTTGNNNRLLRRLEEIAPDANDWANNDDTNPVVFSETFLNGVLTAAESPRRDCGCGQRGCGESSTGACLWMIPMKETAIDIVLQSLEEYACHRVVDLHYRCQEQRQQSSSSPSSSAIPTAHQLIKLLADRDIWDDTITEPSIPPLLRFWENEDGSPDENSSLFPPELQLLMIKLLFQVLPSLAMEAVVRLRLLDDDEKELALRYKSHYAYYVFVKALVLGIRIKPHRKRLQQYHHVPLWDRLWGLDDDDDDDDDGDSCNNKNIIQNDDDNQSIEHAGHQQTAKKFVANLRRLLRALRDGSHNNSALGEASLGLVWMPPFRFGGGCITKPIFLVGDSHVFSLAWNTVQIPNALQQRLVVPVVVTGLKAWHVRSSTRFFTRSSLEIALQRLDCETILFSAGEIDCREGLGGPLLEGYTHACHDHVVNTVREYVHALDEIVQDDRNAVSQILVLPVAPHLYRTKGRIEAQASRRETMRVWNAELRQAIRESPNRIHLLDYADKLQAGEHATIFALNPAFNADSTHMNSAFIPVFEQALKECGCNFNAL